MTTSSRQLRHAVRLSLAAVASAATVPLAFAQTSPAAQAPTAPVQEVVVTGSRIQQAPNDVSISPVVSVSSLDIQQTGLVRTEDLLNNLPQVVAENSSGQSISSAGNATVSLRGLGSPRTMVQINGRRMSPGAALNAPSASGSPDIDQIPAALIQRVDVLTGGASAVYGADAVAGVVNFVLDTHYEGVKIDANYGFAHHTNDNGTYLADLAANNDQLPASSVNAGFNKDVAVLVGANFADGKGNATVYFTYLNSAPVAGYQYDYAGCTLNTPGTLPAPGKALACGGSSSSATGRFLDFGVVNGAFTLLSDRTVDAANGGFRQYNSATDSYNYGALSYLQRQAERFTSGAFLNYDVSDATNVYSEFMFARNTSQAQYGPSGLFAFGQPTISCSDPLLSAQELATLCSPANIAANQAAFGATGNNITLYAARRSVESGPRLDNYSQNAFREVLGVKGKWNDAWSYDVYGQASISQMLDFEGNFLGTQQINNALNVVPDTRPGTLGQPVCESVLNGSDPACVPWNIWTPGGVTQQALDYLRVQSSYTVKATEYIVSGSATGELGKYGLRLPSAASGVVVNIGAEYREEKYDFDPDFVYANGLESGGLGKFTPVHGEFHVAEAFTELRVPIVDEKPGAYQVSADAGYRYSSYTSGFNTNTYKLGLEWAPVQDLRLRGGYNRAIRAPSIGDLYTPGVIGSGGTADPCWGTTPIYTLAQCERTGVTPAEYGHITPNPAAQINNSAGGNINLTPEIADTYTFGFVAQPRAIPNLVVSVDYYDIKINNTIQALSTNTVLADCANSGSATLCGLVHRGANTGSLWFNTTDYVDTNEKNIGSISTKGIDVSGHYRLDVGSLGRLGLGLSGTRVQNFLTQPVPTGGAYDCAGYFGSTCAAPTPKWRHVLSTDWATPWAGLDLTLRWRYIGSTDVDRSSPDPQLHATYFAPTSHIGGYSYVDLSASLPVASGVSFRLGINNLADKAPPVIANGNYSDCPTAGCNDNTWVGTYDTLGRYMYAHVSVKF